MIFTKRTNLEFGKLDRREETNRLILHHVGIIDRDFSAEEIHTMHLNRAWSGIGYHFVIRKDGTIERGRPEWAIGAHTQDNNYDSLGINIAGDFDIGSPTSAQVQSAAKLIADLCSKYNLPIDEKSILGHCDLAITVCPGKNLYDKISDIRNRALILRLKAPIKSSAIRETASDTLFSLSAKYESSGNPAEVSSGNSDLSGISYGIYKLSSNAGNLQSFLSFSCNYGNDALANYGRVLSQYAINSEAFISAWKSIGTIDSRGFTELQNAYAKSIYYDPAANKLKSFYYNIQTKTIAMQAVLFSRSIQYGSKNMVELYTTACKKLTYPNLSYVDATYFDQVMISAIYDFLIEECDNAYKASNGLYHSPNNWVNGSYDIVKIGLRRRFVNEKLTALTMS